MQGARGDMEGMEGNIMRTIEGCKELISSLEERHEGEGSTEANSRRIQSRLWRNYSEANLRQRY